MRGCDYMSIRKILNFTVIICLFLTAVAFAGTVKVVVKEAHGREGPGSYYALKTLIPEGTVLEIVEQKKTWYKVTYQKLQVWISANSLSVEDTAVDNSEIKDPFAALSTETVPITASPATVTAAIKGFWTRYTGTDKSELVELPVTGYYIPHSVYERFSSGRSREVGRDILLRKYKLASNYKRQPLTYEKEHSIGYTIASSVADAPLMENERIINYIHSVGAYIAEATERYDIRFIYYILDTDRVNAVSCPGGYIVLTRGLLELLNDESELAALLAHEMAHIIAGHAMQEMEDRSVSLKADSAFDRLGRETSVSDVEFDLVGITNRAVSIATSPKLDEQEFEADRTAIRYLARSGYDLNGLTRLLYTLRNKHESNIDIFDLNYRNHPDFRERIRQVEKEIIGYKTYKGEKFSESFRTHMTF